jgi:hypothetical protein
MLRYAARASSDVFLCSLRSHVELILTLVHCSVSQSVCGATMKWAQENTLGSLSYTKKCLKCPKYYNKLHKHFPTTAANNWWIRARSPFAGMRAVLSEPTPRVEQNPALLRCGRLLKCGHGLISSFLPDTLLDSNGK